MINDIERVFYRNEEIQAKVKELGEAITRDYQGSVVTNFTDKDYLINTTGRSPQWNFCIPLSELQTNLGITADDNNPDPTGFTGDPQVRL